MRSVELDLLGRPGLTHAILRPAWFMQNFSETFLKPIGGAIVVPAGDGAEAFVDAEDIAAVASATLADPQAHAGAQYALTGPEALTIAEAARIISDVSGRAIDYTDIDRDEWVAAAVAGGVPADMGRSCALLTETIASGQARGPHDVEKATGGAPAASLTSRGARPRPGPWTRPMTAVRDLADFRALTRSSGSSRKAWPGWPDGEHFFDLLAEDVVFEYVITSRATRAVSKGARPSPSCTAPMAPRSPSIAAMTWPSTTTRRRALSSWNTPRRAGHPDWKRLQQPLISVLSIIDRKIAHWRDYLDPTAVFDAIGWPAGPTGKTSLPPLAGGSGN